MDRATVTVAADVANGDDGGENGIEEVIAADIRRAAIHLLARREHSYLELCTKLSQRFSPARLVELELGKLQASDLQSDQRFCEVLVRSRSQQGYGPHRIARDLRRRGVAEGLIRAYLWDADIAWLELLRQLYAKRYRHGGPVDQKAQAKRIRFLSNRGFGYDLIRDLLEDSAQG